MDGKTEDSLIATGFLRAGPRVLFREKDNPERRFDYLDDDSRHDRQGHAGADGQLRALPRPQVRSDPAEGLLRARRRRSSATSRPRCRWRRRPRPRPISHRTRRSTPGATSCRTQIAAIEKPHRDRLELEQIKKRFSDAIYQAAAKPEARADSRREAARRSRSSKRSAFPATQIDKALTPDELASKRELSAQIAALEKERPRAAADGGDRHRRRLSLLAARRRRRGRQLSEVPDSAAVPGQLPAQGSRPLRSRRRRTS